MYYLCLLMENVYKQRIDQSSDEWNKYSKEENEY
jgi:hypothetical protein